MKSLSRVRPSVTPWTAAYLAPLPMWFSRQEYWSGVPLPSPIVMLQLCWYQTLNLSLSHFCFDNHKFIMSLLVYFSAYCAYTAANWSINQINTSTCNTDGALGGRIGCVLWNHCVFWITNINPVKTQVSPQKSLFQLRWNLPLFSELKVSFILFATMNPLHV